MRRYTTFLIFLWVLATVPVMAQGRKLYEGPGNWFVGIDAGTSLALSENVKPDNFFHTEIPSVSITFGRTFTPIWSMRLSAGFYPQFGHPHSKAVKYAPEMFSSYRFLTSSGSLDLMLNITNLFHHYDVRNWFDLYFIAGGGMLYSFGMDKKVNEWPDYIYPVNSEEKWYWNAKAGLMGAWHIQRSMDFTAELDCFFTDNAYNGVVNKKAPPYDMFLSFRVGVVYYFANSLHRHRYANRQKRHHRSWYNL
mgnify:FL=1